MIEKVAAFVLRPSRQGVEILTLEHPRGGLQVPGGTVNAGEAPETAVLRELHEETGLTEVRIIRKLGEERVDLP
ncbi:MAG TPA: NUDIX domain-containing protein, partial [Anaerolineaceae bacterium]|nr:NUDIX domain-containing protein [Anaerolineaceae bacterium]